MRQTKFNDQEKEFINRLLNQLNVSFEDLKHPKTRKATDARTSIIHNLKFRFNTPIDDTAHAFDMRFCDVLAVIPAPNDRAKIRSDIRAVIQDETNHPSRRKTFQ